MWGDQPGKVATKNAYTWQFFVTFLGWLSDLLERLSDLQLGDQKVTLNHLVDWFPLIFGMISQQPRHRCGHRGRVQLGLFHGTHGVDADDVAQLFDFGSETTECLDVGHVTTGSDGRTCWSYARTAIFGAIQVLENRKWGGSFCFWFVCLRNGILGFGEIASQQNRNIWHLLACLQSKRKYSKLSKHTSLPPPG